MGSHSRGGRERSLKDILILKLKGFVLAPQSMRSCRQLPVRCIEGEMQLIGD